jgi:hypothetical protein
MEGNRFDAAVVSVSAAVAAARGVHLRHEGRLGRLRRRPSGRERARRARGLAVVDARLASLTNRPFAEPLRADSLVARELAAVPLRDRGFGRSRRVARGHRREPHSNREDKKSAASGPGGGEGHRRCVLPYLQASCHVPWSRFHWGSPIQPFAEAFISERASSTLEMRVFRRTRFFLRVTSAALSDSR